MGSGQKNGIPPCLVGTHTEPPFWRPLWKPLTTACAKIHILCVRHAPHPRPGLHPALPCPALHQEADPENSANGPSPCFLTGPPDRRREGEQWRCWQEMGGGGARCLHSCLFPVTSFSHQDHLLPAPPSSQALSPEPLLCPSGCRGPERPWPPALDSSVVCPSSAHTL